MGLGPLNFPRESGNEDEDPVFVEELYVGNKEL